jgi:hypothetical protein
MADGNRRRRVGQALRGAGKAGARATWEGIKGTGKSLINPTNVGVFFWLTIIFHLLDASMNFTNTVVRGTMYLLLACVSLFMLYNEVNQGSVKRAFGLSALQFFLPLALAMIMNGILGGIFPVEQLQSLQKLLLVLPVWPLYIMFSSEVEKTRSVEIARFIFIILVIIMLFPWYKALLFDLQLYAGEVDLPDVSGNVLDDIKKGTKSFTDLIKTAGQKQLQLATGDYYTGQVDKNKEQPLGVYIEDVKASSTHFFEDEPVSVWATLKARTLDVEKDIDVTVTCKAKTGFTDLGNEVMGDADPDTPAKEVKYNVVNYEEQGISCDVPALQFKPGSQRVLFNAEFNFNTISYIKGYFMEQERLRSMRRQGIDPLLHYQVPDKKPVAIYSNGPVAVGMSTQQALNGLTKDGGFRLGVTVENRWEGKIKRIKTLIIKVPEGFEIDEAGCGDAWIVKKSCSGQPDICEADDTGRAKYTKYYMLNPTSKTENGVVVKRGADRFVEIEQRQTFNCKVKPKNLQVALGNTPLVTHYFKVSVDYDYELEKGTSVHIKDVVGVEAFPLGLSNQDILPEALSDLTGVIWNDHKAAIQRASARYTVPKELIIGIIATESLGNPEAISGAGAVGLMQVVPSSAGAEVCPQHDAEALQDPSNNIDCGTKYFKKMYTQFDKDVRKALAAYNAGPERVRGWMRDGKWKRYASKNYAPCSRAGDILQTTSKCQTQNYVPKVLSYYTIAHQQLFTTQ